MAAVEQELLQAELKRMRICRFCLCQDPSNISNIYMRDTRIKSSAPLPIQVMAIASIEVFSNDGMPCFVCTDCTDMFEYSYQFKQMCKKADNLLRQFPLTGKLPACLDRPTLPINLSSHHKASSPTKYTKTTQVRMQHSSKPTVQQESLLLPKKILNSSISSKPIGQNNVKVEECSITIFEKIENNDELSLDDIQQLVAAEDGSEAKYENLTVLTVDPEPKPTKPKLLNKSSIRILNKDAETGNEPRLSLPKIKKDVDGKMEIVAEILNIDDQYEEEADPKNAAPIETNIFPCDFCERTFPLLQLRDIHMKNHSRDRKFQCEYCEKSFFSKYDLQRHSFIHNGEKPFKCSVCDKAFSRSSLLTRHEKTHTDVPKHICLHCERSFLSKDDMERHAERHNINRPFVCKICHKGFAFKQGLERHEVIHSRQQPYSCQYCDRSFSTTTKLSRHLTAHAGSRPYPCKFCKKSYLLSHHLTRHLRSHKNINNCLNAISFMCMRCNTTFDSRDDLINHSTSHANEQNLACPLCKDAFGSMLELTSHIQDHSEGEAYACEFCDLIFMTANKLQIHTNLDHSKEMEAYHADDLAQADKESQDAGEEKVTDADVSDEKLQDAVNEFLSDELSNGGNDSEASITKNIKKEKGSPNIINQIIIRSAGNNQNDKNQSDDKSLLIPLKQRKLEKADKTILALPKMPDQSRPSRRKTPNVSGISATRDANQPSIQSLLKTTKTLTVTKTSKSPPSSKPLPSKTHPSKNTTVAKSAPAQKVTRADRESIPKSLPSTSVDGVGIPKSTSDAKKPKVQKITVTKAQAAAMAKEGRIKIKDGKIILKKKTNM